MTKDIVGSGTSWSEMIQIIKDAWNGECAVECESELDAAGVHVAATDRGIAVETHVVPNTDDKHSPSQ